MASPRSMWSGSIELGLINIPITIGKAFSDERESSFVQVCYHGDAAGASKIERHEYCKQCDGQPQHKRSALAVEGGYRIFDDTELGQIGVDTKTQSLIIEDIQPLDSLPMIFSIGCYYIRHDAKSKVQPRALSRLIAALGKTGFGLICKWGNSSKQKLCVISAERGVLILRVIPYLSEIRIASKKEREHWSVPNDDTETAKMVELMEAVRNPSGFQYASYSDKGLELRQEAIERLLSNASPPEPPNNSQPQIDIFEALEMAIAEQKASA